MDRTCTVGVISSVLIACAIQAAVIVPEVAGENHMEALARGHNVFALDLYERLRGREENLFFSPFSIFSTLAMIYPGARGKTRDQMAQTLGADLPPPDLYGGLRSLRNSLTTDGSQRGYRLNTGNKLWIAKHVTLLRSYLDLLEENYGAPAEQLDFAGAPEKARSTINLWFEKETEGKIKEFVASDLINASTRLILTNAISFRGLWADGFKEEDTSIAPFTKLDGEAVGVPMMQQTASFAYTEGETYQILELPYRGRELSMILLLPKKQGGLPLLEKLLSVNILYQWLGKLAKTEVFVTLPRFAMTRQLFLSDPLRRMGMSDAFSVPPADLSGITGQKDLAISEIMHEATLDLDEKGTVAAAGTAAGVGVTSAPMAEEFRADHPFLFLVLDRRFNVLLFIGRLVNP